MCAERCRVEFRVSEHYTSYSPSSYDERKIYERMLRIEAGFCRMNLSNDVSRFSIRRERLDTRPAERGAGRCDPAACRPFNSHSKVVGLCERSSGAGLLSML